MAPIRKAVSRVMRSLVMKFTLLTGALIFATTLMLMTLESVSAQRETRNLLIDRSVASLQATASRLANAVSDNNGSFVDLYVEELIASFGAQEMYVLNNRREVLGEAYADDREQGRLRAADLAVMALGAGDMRYSVTDGVLEMAAPSIRPNAGSSASSMPSANSSNWSPPAMPRSSARP